MKLNLCCGANVFPGWLNVDHTDVETDYLRHLRDAPDGFVWPEPQRKLAAHVKAGLPLDFMRHDVRIGLPWADGSVDAIYIGQAIEHFNRRTEAPLLLSQCFRILRRGGRIKLTTPSLEWLVHTFVSYPHDDSGMRKWANEQPAFYVDALAEDQLAYLLYGASGADCTAQNYEGHFHCYTPRSLGRLLQECSFDVRDLPHRDDFKDCVDMGMSHSFAIEGVKP